MNRLRFPLAAAFVAMTSGCILLPTDSNPSDRGVNATVMIMNDGRSPDSVAVQAFFQRSDGGGRIAFAHDTLHVQNVAVGAWERTIFHAQVALDSAARAQGIRVRLPQPRMGPLPMQEFTIFSAQRGGPPVVTARAGQDLSLPVIRGASGTLPAPLVERWAITFARPRAQPTIISGMGPIPSPVVIPWGLVPAAAGDTLLVNAISNRDFNLITGADPVSMTVSAYSSMEWTVRLVP
ncbi:hypothetical protein [Longimicrobium terrae]|uniref:Uncharacterized protein n=1 Tax=Longimicrobium terrae TaxID=1639882 RepID=A0A841H048_9BACT|nr:hypothetical protein [Longimicrobium terrae]MBB4637010.1 hypothetical protein [Longimicrobium terrae]MBB6071382.1 hypothetical protein [Longimicrobium terrae]NNC31401.1 hypothetical protein [Longimicrobium terrae]